MICQYCGYIINSLYGSGRFCNSKCAHGFSSKDKRKEISQKVSLKLKGKPSKNKGKISPFKNISFNERYGELRAKEIITKIVNNRSKIYSYKIPKIKKIKIIPSIYYCNFDDLSKRNKRKRILFEQNNTCNLCNIYDWNTHKLILELHHKDGNSKNETRNNMEYLCPNCHSQTKTFRFKGKHHSLVSKERISISLLKID